MEVKLQKLRRFNLIMGAVHFVQAVAMLFLATSVIQKIAEFQPTITQNYLTFNVATKSLEPAGKAFFTQTWLSSHISYRTFHRIQLKGQAASANYGYTQRH